MVTWKGGEKPINGTKELVTCGGKTRPSRGAPKRKLRLTAGKRHKQTNEKKGQHHLARVQINVLTKATKNDM